MKSDDLQVFTLNNADSVNSKLNKILSIIRKHLNMEVAFISEFVDGERVFKFVNAGNEISPINLGESDPLEETYCKRIVDDVLPNIIHNTNGRVEVWRGDRRPSLSVSAPFVRRCLTSRTLAPFPHPARRTRRADFPQRALFQNIKPSHSNGRRATAPGVSAPVFHTGTGRSIGGTPFPVCRAFASTRSADVAPHSCRSGDRPSPPVLG